jgi:hypothetical protein
MKGRPDFYVANQVDITHLKADSGVPLRDFAALEVGVGSAQQALADAVRFTQALERHLSDNDRMTLEREAFLRSGTQAHQEVKASLEQIAEQLEDYTRS